MQPNKSHHLPIEEIIAGGAHSPHGSNSYTTNIMRPQKAQIGLRRSSGGINGNQILSKFEDSCLPGTEVFASKRVLGQPNMAPQNSEA
jgi:hypothetical protein